MVVVHKVSGMTWWRLLLPSWATLLVLLMLLSTSWSAPRCPRECKCRTKGFVDCSFRNLNYVPRGIPKNVQRL